MKIPWRKERERTYKGGFRRMMRAKERRQEAYLDPSEIMPPADFDLDAAEARIVPSLARPTSDEITDLEEKYRALALEFRGRSELELVNALLIAVLRRRDAPDHAGDLFQRLWAEKGLILGQSLSTRWLISTVTTFGDHGVTEAQRRLGQSLTVLFGMMKLYESERQYAGVPATTEFPLEGRSMTPLPMELTPYAIAGGDLDRNLLSRLWADAEGEVVIRPAALGLLRRLNEADDTIFRRLGRMRAKLLAERGEI